MSGDLEALRSGTAERLEVRMSTEYDRASFWLGIKDWVGYAPGGNRGRWIEPKRRRDGDRPTRWATLRI